MSYAVPDEKVVPFIVAEFLSDSAKGGDPGLTKRKPDKPPTKREVCERIPGVPHYAVFSRHARKFGAFELVRGRYAERLVPEGDLWFPEIGLGLGTYQTLAHRWLRRYDCQRRWIPSAGERAEQADQRAEQEKMRA